MGTPVKVTFLGTGTSQGVPLIGCTCEVCTSTDSKDKRLRSSIQVEVGDKVFVIDSGPDFRQQMLRAGTKRLDALIFTHSHKDHIAGMDDIRAFNFHSGRAVDVYANNQVQEALRREFQYIFAEESYPGIPKINLHTIDKSPFFIEDTEIIPIEVIHYKMPVLGFRIGNFSYITDANFISEEEKLKLKGTKTLVLNALRKEKHISHFTLDEAIALAKEIGAEQTYFTHMSHQIGLNETVNKSLPEGMSLAWDGLQIIVD
ncbi:MAG: MBL fold metallo-hydrolase [Bacteroidia bacterium]|nr:MBL fold metallo-hydrolase [Bacteroidia bacterium]